MVTAAQNLLPFWPYNRLFTVSDAPAKSVTQLEDLSNTRFRNGVIQLNRSEYGGLVNQLTFIVLSIEGINSPIGENGLLRFTDGCTVGHH